MRRFLTAAVVAIGSAEIWAGAALAASRTIELLGAGITADVPAHCADTEGPGTIEAVCDPGGKADVSRTATAASALYFEIAVQRVESDARKSGDELMRLYPKADFVKDLPEAVCGEERLSRVKIEAAGPKTEGGRTVLTATVTCPEIAFLGLGTRQAMVQTILGDGRRVHVMARALADDFKGSKAEIDAFFASLKVGAEKKP